MTSPGGAPAPHDLEPIRRFASADWMAELLPRRPYEVRYVSDGAAIGFAFDTQGGEHAFASDRVRPFRARAHSLAFVPAGCEVYSRSDTGGEYLRLVPRTAPSADWGRFRDAVDGAAARAAWCLRALLLMGKNLDPLLFDRHAADLATRASLPHPENADRSLADRWMTPYRLKRIEDFIEAHLETGPSVADMARELGLSPDFFSRAFKAATGETPHAYVLSRRIARARDLIRETGEDLSAVAYTAGFSSHAHMSTAFRRVLGVAPGVLRVTSPAPKERR